MTTHVPDRATAKPLLDADAIAKSLARIAHELIERNDLSGGPDLERLALIGIQTRGAPLASRLRRLVEDRCGVALPVGALDITFHRDDVHVRDGGRPPGRQPIVRATSIALPSYRTWRAHSGGARGDRRVGRRAARRRERGR